MTRKWIAARIDQLDPATDYDEIWKLSAAYRPTDFIMNLVYAVTFPHFFVRNWTRCLSSTTVTGKF